MKIAVCSDLHLEFGPLVLTNEQQADVLILSGDICVTKDLMDRADPEILGMNNKSNQYHEFFQRCCAEFPHVIYVMGNHEHYHGDFTKSLSILRDKLGYLTNLYVLEKEVKVIDDTMFIAGTLWTNMNKEDPITMNQVWNYMNDYRIIVKGDRVKYFRDSDGNSMQTVAELLPQDTVDEHKEMMKVIDHFVSQNPNTKTIVVGHHAPSKQSTKPGYEDDYEINGAYSSDLTEFILDRPSIKLWTHGHTHHVFDYMIGSTRIVCNPRGYHKYEDTADQFTLKYVDV